jgi:hypothetical protein
MHSSSWSRRELLKAAALSPLTLRRAAEAQQASVLPPAAESGIRHIVVLASDTSLS